MSKKNILYILYTINKYEPLWLNFTYGDHTSLSTLYKDINLQRYACAVSVNMNLIISASEIYKHIVFNSCQFE